MVVAMSEVLERHPELLEIAGLPPGWTASRVTVGEPDQCGVSVSRLTLK